MGCTLYYAVTGKVPFPGGSTSDKAQAHRELRPLDPRRLNRQLSDEFVDVMNLPNIGQIDNLPRGVVVETPGMINSGGFHPIACGAMPNALANLCMPHALNNELIVEAGIEGDWDKANHALMNDPLCAHLPLPKIKEMGRKLLEPNKKFLPQFFSQRRR